MSPSNNSQTNIEKFGLDDQTLETVPVEQHEDRIDPVLQKQLLRKIDWHLLASHPPVVWVMFLFSNLDRSNIGNAYAGGMRQDLNMTSEQYSVALLVFFIGYCLFEVPSNMIIARARPSIYLPAIMFTWGAVAIALAGAKNYQQLAGIRAVLGLAEAGFSPGVIFFLSSWYRKNELAGRFCIWWTASPASGAIGGILAGGIIGNMQDTAGLHGWQWLFIIEGIATCVFAVAAFFILPDFPHTTKWLSSEEQELALQRLHADGVTIGDGHHDESHWANLRAAFVDWRTYIFIFLYTMCTGALTITYFIPTLVGSLGYTGATIQYMTVPIYMVCIVFVLVICNHSDYRRDRAYHLAFCGALSAVSFAIIMGVRNRTAQYVFLCFAAAGIWSAIPLILVWVSNIITWPAEKRAIAQAATNAAGNLASIYGAFLWPSRDAPRYYTGFGTTLAFLVVMAIVAITGQMLFKKHPYPNPPAQRRAPIQQEAAKQEEV